MLPDWVTPSTPLRLAKAAELAFPDGSMTKHGLRKEALKGNLIIERIAGKDYTTLAYIQEMRDRCRVAAQQKARGSTYAPPGAAHELTGSSSTPSKDDATRRAQDAAKTIVEGLRNLSSDTSQESMSRRLRGTPATLLRYQSPT
jgi:hypothetical protein